LGGRSPFQRKSRRERFLSFFFSLFSLPSSKTERERERERKNGVFVLSLFSRLLFVLFFFSSSSVCRLVGESSRARKKNKKKESF
jgi:hypothetical protein